MLQRQAQVRPGDIAELSIEHVTAPTFLWNDWDTGRGYRNQVMQVHHTDKLLVIAVLGTATNVNMTYVFVKGFLGFVQFHKLVPAYSYLTT